ncbi:MAG: hypothetical protein K2W96_16365, partial [Gemmataceae bacterium]|nr:hypothetical protein [Gemmataceae bacterium]
MARTIVISYRPMTDGERRFNGALMKWSLILLFGGALLAGGFLALAANVRALYAGPFSHLIWPVLFLLVGLSALGAVGVLWAFKKYRADRMLAKGCDLKDIH